MNTNTKQIGPGENFKAVTPHDTNEIKNAANETISTRGIMCTVTGTICCKNAEGNVIAIPCAAGVVIPIITSVITTASTATGIVVIW